jgi:hypothetical protein
MMSLICIPIDHIIFSPTKIGENLTRTSSNRYLSGSWHSPWPGEPDKPLRIVIDLAVKKVPVIQERLRGRWRPVDAKDHAYIEAPIFEQFEDVCGDADAHGLTPTNELPEWADEAPSHRQKALTEVQRAMETAGWMRHVYDAVIAQHVEKFGDSVTVRRRAATHTFAFFQHEGYPESTARAYLNVHKRFSANATAIGVFKWGELAMLASQTDEHVNALIEAKLARPEMSRDELKTHLDHFRSRTR